MTWCNWDTIYQYCWYYSLNLIFHNFHSQILWIVIWFRFYHKCIWKHSVVYTFVSLIVLVYGCTTMLALTQFFTSSNLRYSGNLLCSLISWLMKPSRDIFSEFQWTLYCPMPDHALLVLTSYLWIPSGLWWWIIDSISIIVLATPTWWIEPVNIT